MPRYFFNIHDKLNLMDDVGTELPDLTTARKNALHYASDILRDRAFALNFDDDWHMEVTDERGLILFCLEFSSFEASAIGGGSNNRAAPFDETSDERPLGDQ